MDAANCELACALVGRTYIQQGAQVRLEASLPHPGLPLHAAPQVRPPLPDPATVTSCRCKSMLLMTPLNRPTLHTGVGGAAAARQDVAQPATPAGAGLGRCHD